MDGANSKTTYVFHPLFVSDFGVCVHAPKIVLLYTLDLLAQ